MPHTGPGTGRTHLLTDLVAGALCAVTAVAVAAFALLNSRRFFYIDDYQTYFMPAVREIARLVRAGEFPFVTDRLWQGGALLPEYQAGVLNPVSIGLYLVMSRLQDPAAAAALFSLSFVALFASGTYFLCRTLGCQPRHAFAAGLIAPTADWIFYWGAANWVLALVGIAWMTWAAALLIKSYHDERWLVPAVVGVALFFTCGWPFGVLAWLMGAAVVFLLMVMRPGRFATWQNLRPWIAMTAGGLMAAPAILPMFPYLAFSERPFDPGKWTANLATLSSVGLPFYATEWRGFKARMEYVTMPMVYIGWFVPLVIANADWRQLWQSFTQRTILILIVCFALLSMFPYLGQFRWMFRLVPYYNLLLVVLMALLLTQQKGEVRWRYFPTALALSFPVVLSIAQVPEAWLLYLGAGLLVLLFVAISLALKANRTAWLAFALVSQVAIVLYTNASYVRSGYPAFPVAWKVPFQLEEHSDVQPLRRRLAVFALPAYNKDPGPDFWREFMPASTSLFSDTISVNGYSPYNSKSYRKNFCFVHLAATACKDIADRLLAKVPPTGLSLIDLMRIDTLVVQNPGIAEQLRQGAGGNWTATVTPTGTTVLERDFAAQAPPDPVSWQSEGLESRVISQSPQEVVLDVNGATPSAGMVVLARAWYPGWSASIDGRPLKVVPLHGLLVSAELPQGSVGRVTFTYWPENFWIGIWIAAIGMAMTLAMLVRTAFFHHPPSARQDVYP